MKDVRHMFFRSVAASKVRVNSFPHHFFSHPFTSDFLSMYHQDLVSVYRKSHPEKNIMVETTKKRELRALQEKFSPKKVGDYSKSNFAENVGIFLYSNDRLSCPKWHDSAKPDSNQKSRFHHNNLALIVGNGNVLSWAPELPADDILLVDCEPLMHYFILSIRELIVTADPTYFSPEMRNDLLEKIHSLEMEIFNKNRNSNFIFCPIFNAHNAGNYSELNDSHFLSSKSRFEKCRQALILKELLPINLDLFNITMVREFSDAMKKTDRQLSYINLSNLQDYDKDETMLQNVSQLPFSDENLKIITTSRNRNLSSRHIPSRVYLSHNLAELKTAITVSRNLAMKNLLNYDEPVDSVGLKMK